MAHRGGWGARHGKASHCPSTRTTTPSAIPCLIAAQLVMFASAVPTNPFCAYDTMRNTVTSQLSCVNGVIDSITAFLGTPSGECPSFKKGAFS